MFVYFLSPICSYFRLYFQLHLCLSVLFLIFLSYTTILLITAKCKEQNWVLMWLNHKPPYSDVTTVFYPVCLFIFSLARILIFSTRHIGTIIFTLFYAPCCVCLQAHSKRLLPQQLIIFQALWDLFTSLCQRGTMFFEWL